MRVLILGGTREGRLLAERLAGESGIVPILSLAGVTRAPEVPAVALRVGGFGGDAGLEHYLRTHAVALVVDATHPLACRITPRAHRVCHRLGIGYLRIERPRWRPQPGDAWYRFESLDAALAFLPGLSRRPFVTLARAEIAKLARVSGCRFLLRTIEPVPSLPANVTAITARPPYTVEGECALLRRFRVDGLLFRNSGGEGASAKIEAARRLSLPMLVIEYRTPVVAPAVATVDEAYDFVLAFARGRSR